MVNSPKTLQHWRDMTSQQQTRCCTVSVSNPQNLQDGSPSYRTTVRRWPLTEACPVRTAAISLGWCLSNFSKSSALSLYVLPINSLPCLQPGILVQVSECWSSVQFLKASHTKHLGVPTAGSGPSEGAADACLSSLSASLLPRIPWCPGTHMRVTLWRFASANSASWHSATV